MTDRIHRMIREKLAAGQDPEVNTADFIDHDPPILKELTRRASNNDVAKYQIYGEDSVEADGSPKKWPTVTTRLKVGFISADWGIHPVSSLIRGMFGVMDTTRFEIYAFALQKSDSWYAAVFVCVCGCVWVFV
jgi:predicted O-linked N-acetylglucosamine transferase (SPINDLY family)